MWISSVLASALILGLVVSRHWIKYARMDRPLSIPLLPTLRRRLAPFHQSVSVWSIVMTLWLYTYYKHKTRIYYWDIYLYKCTFHVMSLLAYCYLIFVNFSQLLFLNIYLCVYVWTNLIQFKTCCCCCCGRPWYCLLGELIEFPRIGAILGKVKSPWTGVFGFRINMPTASTEPIWSDYSFCLSKSPKKK